MDTIRRLCTTSEDNTDGNSAKKKDSEIWIVAAERGKAISWFNHALGRAGDNPRARNSPSLARLQCLQADSSRLAERLTAIRGGLMTDDDDDDIYLSGQLSKGGRHASCPINGGTTPGDQVIQVDAPTS